MKVLKNFFLISAFVLAIGAAFATNIPEESSPLVLQGYRTGQCTTLATLPDDCQDKGTSICTISSNTWYQTSGCTSAFNTKAP